MELVHKCAQLTNQDVFMYLTVRPSDAISYPSTKELHGSTYRRLFCQVSYSLTMLGCIHAKVLSSLRSYTLKQYHRHLRKID